MEQQDSLLLMKMVVLLVIVMSMVLCRLYVIHQLVPAIVNLELEEFVATNAWMDILISPGMVVNPVAATLMVLFPMCATKLPAFAHVLQMSRETCVTLVPVDSIIYQLAAPNVAVILMEQSMEQFHVMERVENVLARTM